ncbi:unnamed protein product [Boreogadus saida]
MAAWSESWSSLAPSVCLTERSQILQSFANHLLAKRKIPEKSSATDCPGRGYGCVLGNMRRVSYTESGAPSGGPLNKARGSGGSCGFSSGT